LKHGLDCKADFVKVSGELGRLLGVNGGSGSSSGRRVVATYQYKDESGTLLFEKLRFEPKDFTLDRKLDGVRRVPYRLPELVAADASQWVWIVEGEKDVDRLVARGFVATSSPFGASKTSSEKKWPADFNEFFANRKVALIPDNDEAGIEFVHYIAGELLTVATEVRIVELPGAAAKGDVSDFFDAGHTREELLELLDKAPKETDLRQRYRKDNAAAGKKRTANTSGPKPFAFALELEAALASFSPALPTDDLSQRLRDLASRVPPLPPAAHAMWREGVLKKLAAFGFNSPAKIADALLPSPTREEKGTSGTDLDFEALEPAEATVVLADLLDELVSLFKRYLVLPEHGYVLLALWTVLTFVFDSFDICPLLAVVSPTKRCGKTRVLEVLSIVAYRPTASSNISSSSVYRTIDRWHPTLLVDEYDTIRENEELRGIFNSGHTRRLAYVIRNVGDEHEPKRFSTWGCKALALIGRAPETIEDRSLLLPMRRKTRGEKVERLRTERLFVQLRELRERLFRWAKDNADALRLAEPAIPDGLYDRAADNWTPIFAVADLAGGSWPKASREAATKFSSGTDNDTAGVLLLEDLRALFAELGDKIASATIVDRLVKIEERPWPEWGKARKPITQTQLARLLKPFGIKPKTVRLKDQTTPKGYDEADCADAFERYLSADTPSPPEGGDSEPPQRHNPHDSRAGSHFQAATPGNHVADEKPLETAPEATCGGVAAQNPVPGPEQGMEPSDDREEGDL
jgi:Protein of unknown function (DUF3631)